MIKSICIAILIAVIIVIGVSYSTDNYDRCISEGNGPLYCFSLLKMYNAGIK